MSITIRLSRVGRKNLPAYKIVVAQTRDKRNGKALDVIGHYNPSMNPASFNIDKEKFEDWKGKGALVSEAVQKLVKGEYEYVVYEPKKVAKKERVDDNTPVEGTEDEIPTEQTKQKETSEKEVIPEEEPKPEENDSEDKKE